jgi:pimeloyl-ACP methyl ester carboxylesterase
MTLHLVDTSRPTVSHGQTISPNRSLVTLVWVPERSGRSPLIVFAHGFEVGPAPYAALLEAWAAHGYVVAAPEFPLTDAAVAGSSLDEADINNQPEDVRFVTDSLVSQQSPIADRIDPTRVAVAGHSDGAETALAASANPTPAGEPMYRAVVAFGAQPLLEATGPNPPILVEQGDGDEINPPSLGYTTFAEATSPKYLVVAKGGGHLPPLEAGSQWLPGIEAVTEAFLDAYVAGDASPGMVSAVAGSYQNLSFEAGDADPGLH